jgi:YD repeat-containing protein
MKKIMFLFIAVVLSTMMFAQDKKMTEIKTAQLPKSVTDFISKNFPGGTVTRAGKIEEKSDVSYVAVIENKGTKHAYQFDKDGKLIGKADNMMKPQDTKQVPKPAATETVPPKK